MDEHELPVPVARVLAEPPLTRSRELWSRIEAAREERRAQRGQRLRRAMGLAMVAALALFFVLRDAPVRAPEPLALRSHGALPASIVADEAAFRAVDLSDGSRITVAAGAKLDVLIASPRHVELVLRQGRARFDVRPRGPRSWRIQSSGVSVEVVGTSFVVERSAAAVSVDVLHGVVLVRGAGLPDGVRKLTAGDSVRVAIAAPRAEDRRGNTLSQAFAASESVAQASDAPAPGAALGRPQRTARAQGASAAPAPARMPELWRAVDAARLKHAPQEAIAILDVLAQREVRASQRALASFTAGKIALDELNAPARAARDLASAVALGLPSSLEIDARTRLVEAHARAGDRPAACAAARSLAAQVTARAALVARHCDP